jgi:hypothetical protein
MITLHIIANKYKWSVSNNQGQLIVLTQSKKFAEQINNELLINPMYKLNQK